MSAAAIGTRVLIRKTLDVGQHHAGRWGEIVAGPQTQFGERRYQVRVDLMGRETVPQTVWLPAKHLLIKRSLGSS